jgi:hypothetical protein
MTKKQLTKIKKYFNTKESGKRTLDLSYGIVVTFHYEFSITTHYEKNKIKVKVVYDDVEFKEPINLKIINLYSRFLSKKRNMTVKERIHRDINDWYDKMFGETIPTFFCESNLKVLRDKKPIMSIQQDI